MVKLSGMNSLSATDWGLIVSTRITTWPSLVNLMALFARLIRICLILEESPITQEGTVD
jgi:hypothetical protein